MDGLIFFSLKIPRRGLADHQFIHFTTSTLVNPPFATSGGSWYRQPDEPKTNSKRKSRIKHRRRNDIRPSPSYATS